MNGPVAVDGPRDPKFHLDDPAPKPTRKKPRPSVVSEVSRAKSGAPDATAFAIADAGVDAPSVLRDACRSTRTATTTMRTSEQAKVSVRRRARRPVVLACLARRRVTGTPRSATTIAHPLRSRRSASVARSRSRDAQSTHSVPPVERLRSRERERDVGAIVALAGLAEPRVYGRRETAGSSARWSLGGMSCDVTLRCLGSAKRGSTRSPVAQSRSHDAWSTHSGPRALSRDARSGRGRDRRARCARCPRSDAHVVDRGRDHARHARGSQPGPTDAAGPTRSLFHAAGSIGGMSRATLMPPRARRGSTSAR